MRITILINGWKISEKNIEYDVTDNNDDIYKQKLHLRA